MIEKFIRTYKSAYSGLPRAAWLLAFVILVNRSGSIVLFFLTLYLTRELHFSVAVAGRMITIWGFGSIVGAYAGGWLSDVVGTKNVQLYSLVLSGIGFIILGYISTPFWIAITIFIVSVISESFRPANFTAMAAVCSPQIRARGFALSRLAVNLGVTIGPAVGGFLATLNYCYLFWVDGLTCLGAAWVVWYFFHKNGAAQSVKSVEENNTNHSPWKDGVFLSIIGLVFAIGIIFYQLFNTWPLYMNQVNGFLENKIGLLMALNGILIVLVEMPMIHRLEHKNPLRFMTLGTLLIATGFGIIPLNNNYSFIVFTVVLWTFGEMLVFPLTASFIANRSSAHNRGKYLGLYTLSFSLSFVLGPFLGSWIYEVMGPVKLWIIAGLFGLCISMGFKLVDRILKQATA